MKPIVISAVLVAAVGACVAYALCVRQTRAAEPADHPATEADVAAADGRPTTAPSATTAAAPVRSPTAVPADGAARCWTLRDEQQFAAAGPLAASPWFATDSTAISTVDAEDASGRRVPRVAVIVAESAEGAHAFGLPATLPHAVRWELTLFDPDRDPTGRSRGYRSKTLACDEDGCSIAGSFGDDGLRAGDHRVVVERDGDRIAYSLDGVDVASVAVAADDRAPLRVSATTYPVAIASSRVWLRAGDEPSPPDARPAAGRPPTWATALTATFDDAASTRALVTAWGEDGAARWWPEKQALFIGPVGGSHEAFGVIHRSLPGDVRLTFRALRERSANALAIGVFFACDGLSAMDGYYAEWAWNGAQLKRRRVVKRLVAAPTPSTADRWVRLGLSRVGATITMTMEDREVLTWTDPHPLRDPAHELTAFYAWNASTLIDDLVIERNAADPTPAHADDPARPDWIADGRPPASTTDAADF